MYEIGIPLFVGIVVFLLKSSISNLIERHYSQLSKAQVARSYYFILFLSVAFAFVLALGGDLVFDLSGEKDMVEVEKTPERAPTKDEVIVDAIIEGTKIGAEMLEDRRERIRLEDSIHRATVDQKWVYQIGEQMSKKSALRMYNGVKSLEGTCLFKDGRNKYRLIVMMAGSSEEALKANLPILQESLSHVPEAISVVDLTTSCSRKEVIFKRDPIESGDDVISCYECRKE